MEVQLINKKIFDSEANPLNLKILSLWFFGIIAAFGFALFLKLSLDHNSWNFALLSFILGVCFLALFLLQSLFTGNKKGSGLAILLQSLALTAVFFSQSYYFSALAILVFFCLYSGYSGGRNLIENTLKINFWKTGKAVLPKGVLAISLVVSVLISVSFKSADRNFPLPFSFFEDVLNSSKVLVRNFFPDMDPSMTFEEAAAKTAEVKLNAMPEVKMLSAGEKRALVKQAAGGFYQEISNYTGVPVNKKSKISEWLYNILKEKFINLSDSSKNLIFLAIGAIIFLSIETLSLPIRIIVSLLAFIIYEIMLSLGFVKIQQEDRSKEVLIM